ncbi:MAG: hypothetical protein QF775_00140 [archaeon]|nr:hypothetical protein [archaeon]
MQKQYIIFGIILLLVAAGAYYYYTQYQNEPPISPPQGTGIEEEEGGLGAELFEQVDSSDVTNQIPDTNPFDGDTGAVNPFGDTKTNPFERENIFQGIFGN